jgi:fructokinase
MPSVIRLGEPVMDMHAGEADASLSEALTFVRSPGGAPAGVGAALVRLGVSAGFIGAVGDAPFGRFLAARK